MNANPYPYRLRPGDVIEFSGKPCRVIRVNECAAVIAVDREPREFHTFLGELVRLTPKPALVRISANSDCQILNRRPNHQPTP